ncbi:MAG: transcription elongation factor [Desulfurococcales archaeon]|nr:transcription elongation factor [Desulfurococcales archaeon]
MKVLLELEEQGETWLRNSEYVKAYMLDGFLVILIRIRGHEGFSLSRAAREIARRVNARYVKIIDYRGKDLRYLARQLVSPAKVYGVNIVYMPDGSTVYTIRVSRRDMNRLPIDKELLEKALSTIYGEPVSIVPEAPTY